MAIPRELIEHWLNTLLTEASDNLTDWESKFVDDITMRIANNWPLTESQEKKLEQIYAEKTS